MTPIHPVRRGRKKERALEVPNDVRHIAQELRAERDYVSGVFFGLELLPDGRWSDALGLTLHCHRVPETFAPISRTSSRGGLHGVVARTRDLGHQAIVAGGSRPRYATYAALARSKKKVTALAPHVLHVGHVRAHLVDIDAGVSTAGPRRGSLTALRPTDAGSFALMSGHVALPLDAQGQVVSSYPGQPLSTAVNLAQEPMPIAAGDVQIGSLGGQKPYDWAVAWFPNLSTNGYQGIAIASSPDIPLRATAPVAGETVRFWSRTRARVSEGLVGQVAAYHTVTIFNGQNVLYADVVAITSSTSGDRFSVPGDSGAMIVDDHRQAFGMVLAGAASSPVCYATQLRFVATAYPNELRRFFQF